LIGEDGHGNPVVPIPAREVLGLVAARRGLPGAADGLDEAWALAKAANELQRIRPIAVARAEVAWLAGDLDGVDRATSEAYDLALGVGQDWDIGELAVWRHRAGVLDLVPEACAAPFALEIAGQAREAAEAWRELGAPYAQALALISAGDEDSLRQAIGLLDGLGAVATARIARDRLRRTGAAVIPRGPRPSTQQNPARLTRRQLEVLRLVAGGLTNAQIADRLFLSAKTVEHHVAAVMDKLGVRSRGDAASAARALGVELAPQDGEATDVI
jgi:DNA-binding CsgD family transcriptional regulator